jgi:hypothetical protein
MDFIKKHYEKILLGVVLLGLTVAVGLMLIKIPKEKDDLKETTMKRTTVSSKPLPAPDVTRFDAAYGRLEKPAPLNFSGQHNLFNPAQWQRQPDGRLVKMQTSGQVGPAAAAVLKMNPLYTTITCESVGVDANTFLVGIQREAELSPSKRRKKSTYASLNSKGESFTLREVKGSPEKPKLTLELVDTGERIEVSGDQPYKRVDGYSADLRYDPEKKTWPARRVGDRVVFGGDEFTVAAINLVATNQFEVVLSAKSTGKKTTIRFNAAM